jgi:ABC-2 type transport system permease protein
VSPERHGGGARILDRGYRSYDGPRRGVAGAVRSLTLHSVQRVLGYRRSGWTKVLPILSVVLAYVPAIVFVGLTVLIEDLLVRFPDVIPSYADYYGFVWAAIFVFVAFVAPELLCTDRRTGLIGLYLASPLTRGTYLLAKAAAVAVVLGIVTLGPPLFMLVARTIAGSGPDGPGEVALVLVRVLASGLVMTALYGALSLAVAATTTRKAAASAAIVVILIGSAAVASALADGVGTSPLVRLLDLLNLPIELVYRVYGETSPNQTAGQVSTAALSAAYVAWTAAFAAFVVARYRRLAVTR